MTSNDFTAHLERIASDEEFAARSAELIDDWTATGAGIEAVEPILRFMEAHPQIDFGMPGALVHFVEHFYRNGYEERLTESVRRKPTLHTVWMLNRVINGTNDSAMKARLVAVLQEARVNPLADHNTLQQVESFLERIGNR